MGTVFVGHDWAEAHHDVFVEDGDGRRLGGGHLPEGVDGEARFHALVADHVEDPADVVIATDRPGSSSGRWSRRAIRCWRSTRSRPRGIERLSTSGAKSDPGDARVLAELARLDGHNHRPVAGDSELVDSIKVLARAHQCLIWTWQRQLNQLRSTLREFYPAAIAAFPS